MNDMNNYNKKKRIFEGKTKILYETSNDEQLVMFYKDSVTANNNEKADNIEGKGLVCRMISQYLMTSLQRVGIASHFIRQVDHHAQLIKSLDMIQLEVVIRNYAAGSLVRRFKLPKHDKLSRSIVEFYLKDEVLGDPLVTDEHITCFGIASPPEIDEMMSLSLRINDFLSGLFYCADIKLVDLKLEFGRLYDDSGDIRLIIGDELSPDNMRLIDLKTSKSLDKDVFREDTGDLLSAYQEVAKRLKVGNVFNVISSK